MGETPSGKDPAGGEARDPADAYAPDNLLGYVDWFEIRDRQRLRAALRALDDVEPGREDEWAWSEASPDGRRRVAELAIEGNMLAVETRTEVDAERCRTRLEAEAGSAVEFMIGQECFKPWGPAPT